MSDQKPEETEETEEKSEGTEETPATDEKGDDKESKLSHEDALKELSRVRAEAANYRTKLREAEKNLANAKTPEDIEAARAELSTRIAELEHEVLVSKVARKYELPDELAARLRGANEDELAADAKALQKFIVKETPEQLDGGLTPGEDDGIPESDPRALAKRVRGNRR